MKRPILIQGAMDVEVNYLIDILDRKEKYEYGIYEFYKGYIKDYPVVISRGRVGGFNTSASLAIRNKRV